MLILGYLLDFLQIGSRWGRLSPRSQVGIPFRFFDFDSYGFLSIWLLPSFENDENLNI